MHRSPIITSETNITRLGYLDIALKKLQESQIELDDEGKRVSKYSGTYVSQIFVEPIRIR